VISQDFISKTLFDGDINIYVPNPEHTKIQDIKIRLELLQKKITPQKYIGKIFEVLKEKIAENKKKEIDYLAKSICTTLINIGLSKSFLYKETNNFFFSESAISDINQIDDFIEKISPKKTSYSALFKVSSLFNAISESSDAFGINIRNKTDGLEKFNIQKNNFQIDQTKSYAIINNIKSFDSYSAAKSAEKKIEKISNLYALFHHKVQISWDQEVLIRGDESESEVKITTSNNPVKNGFDLVPQKAAKILNNVIRNLRLESERSFSRFDNVVDLHALAAKSDSSSSQLVNIWISLETITPANNAESKIKNITKRIIPFLMYNYTLRIINRIQGDLLRWDRSEFKKAMKATKCDSTDISLKTLNLLCNKENQDTLNEIYRKLEMFPLLKNRVYNISETFRCPKKIKKLINDHMKKVEWQIRRIYRTRNMIVHSGKTPAYIETLVENAHDYLDQILNEIMNLSGEGRECSTLEQCYEITKIKFESYMTKIHNLTEVNNANYQDLIREDIMRRY